MSWTEPQFSRADVNAAARMIFPPHDGPLVLTADQEYEHALNVVNNWRSSHSYPLNTFQVTLRAYARRVDNSPLIAQRMKRFSSIEAKLRRFPNMKFTQMQDIGGCRAVVRTIGRVQGLVEAYRESGIKHERASLDDYIAEPQTSGYRGVHLVYRYRSDKQRHVYNGLKIEIQLRSQYQHAWATAVETVGTFVHQALKSSSGEPEWLRFFALMGTAIAMREKTAPVPNTSVKRSELLDELKELATRLHVSRRLRAYGNALQAVGSAPLSDAHFYLLVLDPAANQLRVTGYSATQVVFASDAYQEAEKIAKSVPGMDAVLVSVDSLAALERAYPNYFADTRIFLDLLAQTLTKRPKVISFIPKKIQLRTEGPAPRK